jgi:hypothetical protein
LLGSSRQRDAVGATAEQVRVHRDWDEYGEARRDLRHAASASVVVECAPSAAAEVVTAAMQLGVDEIAALRYSLQPGQLTLAVAVRVTFALT